MIDNLWIVGSPEDAVEQILNLYEDVDGFGTLLVMGHEWKPEQKWKNSIKLLVNEVMPAIKEKNLSFD